MKTRKVSSITPYNKTYEVEIQNEDLKTSIKNINQEIREISKNLIKAQNVTLRSLLSNQRGWLQRLQRNFFINAAQESAEWHKDRLLYLYKKRQELQRQLDINNGIYWKTLVKNFIVRLIIILIFFLSISVLIMSFMFSVYLIPIWTLGLLIYLGIKKFFK